VVSSGVGGGIRGEATAASMIEMIVAPGLLRDLFFSHYQKGKVAVGTIRLFPDGTHKFDCQRQAFTSLSPITQLIVGFLSDFK
jgi:hypothetical protein